ncbi:MAG: alanine racemase [Chloroflexia bacterium]|nr:alanine racemase [Chloroflexia bacterium]
MRESSPNLTGLRPTRAIVDLDAIAGNVQALRAMLPKSTELMAVVKADAYGHGAPWIARVALEAGAKVLAVATVSEGQELRFQGIAAPIVLLGSIEPDEVVAACRASLEITVADEVLLEAVQLAARSETLSSRVAVHLKIDTGLRRNGALPELATSLAARIAVDPELRFAGIFTHFASADEPGDSFTADQLQRFAQAIDDIRDAGVACPPTHAANSAAIITGQGTHFELVRAGIALYGVPPSADVPLPEGMTPALRIESHITRIFRIEPGDTVGYNRTYRAERSTRGALIPIGYADGYRRSLSGRAWVGINGHRAPVLGRVSMDQIVVEVPPGAQADIGDAVAILDGNAAQCAPGITELAELMGTNGYEVLTGIRRRIPRVYIKDGEIFGVRPARGGQT